MAYGFIIATEDQMVQQFVHETGAAVRSLGSGNDTFSPYFITNFDPTTGLPLEFAIAADEFSNPCSLTSDEESVYVYDAMACRITRWDAAPGDIVQTFGGKRGIGAGRISPDASLRNILQLANGMVWATDNDDGVGGSGTGFLVAWSPTGVFQQEVSIAALIGATALSFDQVTGIAWDTARGHYWALCGGTLNLYLIGITTAGVWNGVSIDLTARLLASLALSVPGHGGSPAGRLMSRGLRYCNGYLYLIHNNFVIRVSIPNPDGDRLITTTSSPAQLGHLDAAGTELTYSLTSESNGFDTIEVLTLEGASSRTYAPCDQTPDGGVGDVSGAWDSAVVPFTEDLSSVTSRTLEMRARIDRTFEALLSMKAAIANAVTRTLSMQARILIGVQNRLTMRARIDEPTTFPDSLVESWTLTDEVSAFSRGLTLNARGRGTFDIGDSITVYAGYGLDRIKLMRGTIDEITQNLTVNEEGYTITCRDEGSNDIDNRMVTRTFNLSPPNSRLSAHRLAESVCVAAGVPLGSLEFPDYPIFGSFSIEQRTPLDVIQQLLDPFAQFPSQSYVTQVREGRISVIRLQWTGVSTNGKNIYRAHLKEMTRTQQRYLESPNLRGFTEFIVTGATFTLSIRDAVGPETKVEYFKDEQEGSVGDKPGDPRQWVVTETVNIELVCGDKVLERTQEIYTTTFSTISTLGSGATKLTARTTEEYVYYEPAGGTIGFTSDQISICPSDRALTLYHTAIHEGIDSGDQRFKELRRNQTNYYYDSNNKLCVESTATRELENGTWRLSGLSHRLHSRITGGTVSTLLSTFTIDEGVAGFDNAESQQVGGDRPGPSNAHTRVLTFQARSPEIEFIAIDDPVTGGGKILDFGREERYVWTYENPHIGQLTCDLIRELATTEKSIQTGNYKWDIIDFTSVLNPGLHVGDPVSIEVAEDEFVDFWLESLTHEFGANQAITRGRAKRLTTDTL